MKKGFTLVELLVVVAILGVLAAVGIVSFGGFLSKSKINAAEYNFKIVRNFVLTGIQGCDAGVPIYLEYAGILRGDDWCACSPPYEDWCKGGSGETDRLAERYTQHFRDKMKNPYSTSTEAVRTSCPLNINERPGCIEIYSSPGTDEINFSYYNKDKDGNITCLKEKVNLINFEITKSNNC